MKKIRLRDTELTINNDKYVVTGIFTMIKENMGGEIDTPEINFITDYDLESIIVNGDDITDTISFNGITPILNYIEDNYERLI